MKKMAVPIVLFMMAAPLIALADGEPDYKVLANAKNDYKAHCAGCHGADAMTTPRRARALGVDFKTLVLSMSSKNKDEMRAIIKKGVGIMPTFEKELTDEQISAIIDYVLLLNKR
jgi:mono/diheme cytochrome c family protein